MSPPRSQIVLLLALAAASPSVARRKARPAEESAAAPASPSAGEGKGERGVAPADPEIDALLRGLAGKYDARKESRDRLVARGPAITARLLPLLDEQSWEYRWEIVNVLGYLEDPKAVQGLVERVVADPNRHVRWRSLWAVAVTDPGGRLASPLLRVELDSRVESRRWNAVVGLTMFEDASVVPLVHERLASGDWWIRWEAVNALGRVHDEHSSSLLAGLIEGDSDASVRREGTFVLGVICDAKARELLAKGVSDADPQVRWRAAMGLGRCEDASSEPLLRQRLDVEDDELVRTRIGEALERLAKAPVAPKAAKDARHPGA
jgi:HEAT repeat protein